MGGMLLHCVLRELGSCLGSQGVAAEKEGGEVPLVVVHIGGPAEVTVCWGGGQEAAVMDVIPNACLDVSCHTVCKNSSNRSHLVILCRRAAMWLRDLCCSVFSLSSWENQANMLSN